MEEAGRQTLDLLQRWHQGDREALELLLQRHLPFIRRYVSKRLGPALRGKGETVDFVQDAMVEFLRYGPRFLLADEGHFRALMVKVIENVLRDRHDWFTARRRDLRRERPLPRESLLGLDPPARSVTRPSQASARHEEEAWIRLALELLEPEDRRVIMLRTYEELSYGEIATRLGIGESAARMRFNRALPRLARKTRDLRQGRLERALESGTR
jgi:RNA polymerase sigma-70 factor (ECF subfamily)